VLASCGVFVEEFAIVFGHVHGALDHGEELVLDEGGVEEFEGVELVEEEGEEFGELLASEFFVHGEKFGLLLQMSFGVGVVDFNRNKLTHNVAQRQRVPQVHFYRMLPFLEITQNLAINIMRLPIVFKQEHEVTGLACFSLLRDQVLAFGRGVALEKPDQFVAD
jgi:hypothetical protein